MAPKANELIQVAREYCALIEALNQGQRAALVRLNDMLPRLHAAMNAVGPVPVSESEHEPADLDQRFELFSRLHRVLGDLDAYWMEFDVTSDGQEMSGSLADDLTDIYWELKHGLDRLASDHDANTALGQWRTGFCRHWGQHVVDAERHLYALSARDRLY